MQILPQQVWGGLGFCISDQLPAGTDGTALQTTSSATKSYRKVFPKLADKNHLDAGEKYRFLGPTPDPLNQNLRRKPGNCR